MVVRAGGPPSTNVLILAFLLPASLFIGTLVVAARVADDLDERFLREVHTAPLPKHSEYISVSTISSKILCQ
jgi:hypothetical protein